jgi:hypothetical protein
MDCQAKKLKALNDRYIISKIKEKSLILLGMLSLSNNAKAKSEGSTSAGGEGGHIGEPV